MTIPLHKARSSSEDNEEGGEQCGLRRVRLVEKLKKFKEHTGAE